MSKVIFRVDAQGVFGIYPERPHAFGCQSTRGPMNLKKAIRNSRPAKPEQYKTLKERLGNVTAVLRETPAMRKIREALAYMPTMKPVANLETANRWK